MWDVRVYEDFTGLQVFRIVYRIKRIKRIKRATEKSLQLL